MMKKINWKPKGLKAEASAYVGCIRLCCYKHYTRRAECRWYASVGHTAANMRYGPKRCSSSKAKEDAVRLARELLLDYQAGLTAEMKNFDL